MVKFDSKTTYHKMLTTYKAALAILAACMLQNAEAFLPIYPSRVISHGSALSHTGAAAFFGPRRAVTASQVGLHWRRRSKQIQMVGRDGQEDVPILERFVACLPYALPLSDSFEWGHYLFDKFPLFALPFVPLFPVIRLLNTPFVSFGVFIILFSFVARNPAFSRFVRFNTLQAIYLDIVLIFPQILKSFNLFGPVPTELAEVGSNTVFYAITLAILYSAFCNIGGKVPNEIPLVSESVDSQLPF